MTNITRRKFIGAGAAAAMAAALAGCSSGSGSTADGTESTSAPAASTSAASATTKSGSSNDGTMSLVIIRHGESEWNKQNLFTGWTDVDLSDEGRTEAAEGGKALAAEDLDFDLCFTSYLKRAIYTLDIVLKEIDRSWLPVVKSWKLNERHYGALQGLNKSETAEKYGEEQVQIWRRSYDVRPPALEEGDERDAHLSPAYRDVDPADIPMHECLKDTIDRAWPYFESEILPQMRAGKRVLIAAHGNSLRALVMKFEKLSEEEIVELNIPTAIPIVYKFDQEMNVLEKRYIGDPAVIEEKVNKVANQGKAK
jgi:2,3-bisphosphoglycerate-dependent phosphoglycerate mutase